MAKDVADVVDLISLALPSLVAVEHFHSAGVVTCIENDEGDYDAQNFSRKRQEGHKF